MNHTRIWCVATIILSGCASKQLNYNTLDLASNADSLLTRQTGHNLANYLDSELSFPAQINIGSGTATTANSVSPTLTAPLGRQFTNTTQIVSTIGGNNPSTATTTSLAGQQAAQSLSVAANDTWTQNYSFTTITDSRQARRLSALYRFAVDGNVQRLIDSYPPIQKSVAYSRPICLRDSRNGAVVYGTASTTNPDSGIPRQFASCVTGYTVQGGISMGAGTDSYSELVDDDYYMRPPHCVLCRKGRALVVSDRLMDRRKGLWLHWRSLGGAQRPDNYVAGDIPIGSYGNYELFVDQRQPEKFAEFNLFILAASTDADSAIGSGGSGAGAAGGGGGGGAASGAGKASPALILLSPNAVTQ